MTRALGAFGFGVAFLIISPRLRNDFFDAIAGITTQASVSLTQYSPFSYVGVGVALIWGVLFVVRKAAAPR